MYYTISYAQVRHDIFTNLLDQRLVNDSIHWNEVLIFFLSNKLRDNPNIIEHSLRIGESHRPIKHINLTILARVVVSVLRARGGVQVKVDTKPVFTCPAEEAQDVCPTGPCEERLRVGGCIPLVDGPEGNRHPNPVQTCSSDLGNIFLGDYLIHEYKT